MMAPKKEKIIKQKKLKHEVRDAVHGFIVFDNLEKEIIDSAPMQRLRNIHQLAMSYQVYPGATHKRFEHGLGVMDVASRIFDSLFNDDEKINSDVREIIKDKLQLNERQYWRRVVRLAGLLHDVGHLPFSHAAEGLLPNGWNHERITAEIIKNSEIAEILEKNDQPIKVDAVVDIAVDARKREKAKLKTPLYPWKTILNEIISGNIFGADRIDYLLRDSYHAGVAYGRFDPFRLIDGLRVVIDPSTDDIAIGLDYNSIHAAEALLLARYFMYTQVYFHDVRRSYDTHLTDFLKEWLPEKHFPTEWKKILQMSDNEILFDAWKAVRNEKSKLYILARRLLCREHFRTVYEMVSIERKNRPKIFEEICTAVRKKVRRENFRSFTHGPAGEENDFPVILESGEIVRSKEVSGVLKNIPPIEIGFVFVKNSLAKEAEKIVKLILGKKRKSRRKK